MLLKGRGFAGPCLICGVFWVETCAQDDGVSPVRTSRLKIQGPSAKGRMASISLVSTEMRSVRGASPTRAAALRRLSHGSQLSSAGR